MWKTDIFEDVSNDEAIEDTEPPASKRKKKNQAQERKSRRRHLLNKSEKNNMTTHILSLNIDSITLSSLLTVSKQLEHVNDLSKQFCDSLVPSKLLFLTKDLQECFVRIYGEVSTAKERYLQFQLKWHNYCSYFLVSENRELSELGLHPADISAESIVSVRSKWRKIYEMHSVSKDTAKTFLISFLGSIFDQLLKQCQIVLKPARSDTRMATEDSEDVYF